MDGRPTILRAMFRSAVACLVLLQALPAVLAQQAAAASEARPGAADAQALERALSLSDEFLVQLALARGLDPARAELLRDLYQERRSARRRDIGEAEAGRMTTQELRRALARASSRLDEQIRALLTPAETLWLADDEARVQAVTGLQRIDAAGGNAAPPAAQEDCAMADAIYRPAASDAAGDWSMEFYAGVDEKTMARVSGPFEGSPAELRTMLFDARGGATYRIGEALAIFFDEQLVSVSPMRSAPAYMFVYGLGSELAEAPVKHRNSSLGDPMWQFTGCRAGE